MAILMVLRTKSHQTASDGFMGVRDWKRGQSLSIASNGAGGDLQASIKNAPQRGLCDRRWRGSLRRKRRDRRM